MLNTYREPISLRFFQITAFLALAVSVALTASCGPASEQAEHADEFWPTDLSAPAVPPPLRDEDLIALVTAQPAPEGNVSVTAWLERQLAATGGQALFPRWQVSRRAANRYEVRFTYTWINRDNQIEQRGYAWSVDALQNTVEGPFSIGDAEPASPRSLEELQQRRAEDPSYNLY